MGPVRPAPDLGDGAGDGSGAMEFVPDGHGGVIVMLDGQPQSHVDPADPGNLVIE